MRSRVEVAHGRALVLVVPPSLTHSIPFHYDYDYDSGSLIRDIFYNVYYIGPNSVSVG